MFGHLSETIIILVIALIVFGPEKLPEVAASAGKLMRELREAMDTAMNPHDVEVPDDFSTYYYESLEHSGEEPPEVELDEEEWEPDGEYDEPFSVEAEDHAISAEDVSVEAEDVPVGSRPVEDHQDHNPTRADSENR